MCIYMNRQELCRKTQPPGSCVELLLRSLTVRQPLWQQTGITTHHQPSKPGRGGGPDKQLTERMEEYYRCGPV
jgi:hypothetical protein